MDEGEGEQRMWAGAWSLVLGFGPGCQAGSKDREGKDILRLPSSPVSAGKSVKYYFL